ncbi:hypothetical protein Aspvir_009105 [Aspergillus viridinutans]|uniref:Uncharacterized protein n=1 Tax=Aspergillus viridinutans TaxID=75553 RepID=A0A9P3F8G0_ASPVI|nr:uncharacterized protein Aspvir_009105 [Aspergillus viridinutans]GIK05006.1 hypothetical protein Aspvir_009105 [Aspergillus viridinutans]
MASYVEIGGIHVDFNANIIMFAIFVSEMQPPAPVCVPLSITSTATTTTTSTTGRAGSKRQGASFQKVK